LKGHGKRKDGKKRSEPVVIGHKRYRRTKYQSSEIVRLSKERRPLSAPKEYTIKPQARAWLKERRNSQKKKTFILGNVKRALEKEIRRACVQPKNAPGAITWPPASV